MNTLRNKSQRTRLLVPWFLGCIFLIAVSQSVNAMPYMGILVDEHGCIYQDSQPYLSYCADEGKWYVRPSNFDSSNPDYGLVDANRLQDGIDAAAEGETVVVMAGTWVFDAPYETDFDIHTARESFKHYEDWMLPWWDYAFATPVHHQDINIETASLTVTGDMLIRFSSGTTISCV